MNLRRIVCSWLSFLRCHSATEFSLCAVVRGLPKRRKTRRKKERKYFACDNGDEFLFLLLFPPLIQHHRPSICKFAFFLYSLIASPGSHDTRKYTRIYILYLHFPLILYVITHISITCLVLTWPYCYSMA